MRRFLSPSGRFLRGEDGPTAVEYALVLALIVVVCIIAITALGSAVTKPFKKYSNSAGNWQIAHVTDSPSISARDSGPLPSQAANPSQSRRFPNL
jgi:pilus assembly protein Flp/PilA